MENINLSNVDEVLKTEPEAAVLTRGVSMRPMLREHRDVVIIERITRPLKKWDVPLYRRKKSEPFVLHRIVKITKDGRYIIRGDNTYKPELNVTDDDMIGVLKAFYREGKYHNCATDKGYKVYIFFNQISYPLRWLWVRVIRPMPARIKRHLKIK